jgi:uncharacterized membrane protein
MTYSPDVMSQHRQDTQGRARNEPDFNVNGRAESDTQGLTLEFNGGLI